MRKRRAGGEWKQEGTQSPRSQREEGTRHVTKSSTAGLIITTAFHALFWDRASTHATLHLWIPSSSFLPYTTWACTCE